MSKNPNLQYKQGLLLNEYPLQQEKQQHSEQKRKNSYNKATEIIKERKIIKKTEKREKMKELDKAKHYRADINSNTVTCTKEIPEIYTVNQISNLLKSTIRENFSNINVQGEISGLKIASSGHMYFNLKDGDEIIGCVSWRSVRLNVKIEDGMEVICSGSLTIYPSRSVYQLNITNVKVSGTGALMLLLEKRKKKLLAEGIFALERKKPLPHLPSIIGIITALSGAVIKDMLHRISDRFPVKVMIWNVPVQGIDASSKIAEAISGFNNITTYNTNITKNKTQCNFINSNTTNENKENKENINIQYNHQISKPDLLILARGGGSFEDLWPFNDEEVIYAIAGSEIPIISAVGHETDNPLSDMAADLRAPTPTAAAEIALPVLKNIKHNIDLRKKEAAMQLMKYYNEATQRLEICYNMLISYSKFMQNRLDLVNKCYDIILHRIKYILEPTNYKHLTLEYTKNIARYIQNHCSTKEIKLEHLMNSISLAKTNIFKEEEKKLHYFYRLLESYSYKNILKRGFVIARQNKNKQHKEKEHVITLSSEITEGTKISLEFQDGVIQATIDKKT